ncbi:MAG: CGGC domain-containing protein [Deltaproteobacteria bacterium]|nr:CGGC domain-containing protein [Deltaproteobacteria bacterium]
MAKEKIGIITCSCATQELNCCSIVCLRDFNKRLGKFKIYPETTTLQLVGIINCAGCPTIAYPEKILKKVDSLMYFGATSIHFTYCMTALCPFLKKYQRVIKKKYPDIQLIEGTHETSITEAEFREKVNCAFKTGKQMADIIVSKI